MRRYPEPPPSHSLIAVVPRPFPNADPNVLACHLIIVHTTPSPSFFPYNYNPTRRDKDDDDDEDDDTPPPPIHPKYLAPSANTKTNKAYKLTNNNIPAS
jgi:hypothetical protein